MFSRLLLLFLFTQNYLQAQTLSIAEARLKPIGSTITVSGIVTNGAELGKIRYFQDGTGGIAAFPNAASAPMFETLVKLGDSVTITGTLVNFHELLEISPITEFGVTSSNNPIPAPKSVTLNNLSDAFEGQLVELECAAFANNSAATFSTLGSYNFIDQNNQTGQIYLRNTSPFFNTIIPTQSVKIRGILSQYDAQYQFVPRLLLDISNQSCFFYINVPNQSNINTTGFTVNWSLNKAAASLLKYGTSFPLSNEIVSTGSGLEHEINLTNLQPGTIYYVQAQATNNGQTINSEPIALATKSLSSGEIKVYFTKSVDNTVGGGLVTPNGQSTQVIENELLARINAATTSIDVAIYNNLRFSLTNALKAAHVRGVRVRYIASKDAQTNPLVPTPPFPVVFGNDLSLMHNKFMVIDVNDANKCWVMGGSMNWTPNNMDEDYNNVLLLQDQSLARTYTLEFEEMWGSTLAQPNAANAKFGAAKKDNTPHQFMIGDVPVECYFSPSDHVTDKIVQTIDDADHDLQFALLTMTKNELGDAVIERHNNNVDCRGIIDNVDDNGSEFNFLVSNGVNVVADGRPEQLHHKYMVTDAKLPSSDPTVLTGSHNWTQTAESSNDENTLIIHDGDIATMFLMEFEKRWSEIVPTSLGEVLDNQSFKVFPNPTNEVLTVWSNEILTDEIKAVVYDLNGKMMAQNQFFNSQKVVFDLKNMPSGTYFIRIIEQNGVSTFPFQKI
jgi:phosphatidylserine/phosphatidylglycerophosphate/cardiolipin synthase-like enzyme